MVPNCLEDTGNHLRDVWRQVEVGGGSLELLKRCFFFLSRENLCRGQSVTLAVCLCLCTDFISVLVCFHIVILTPTTGQSLQNDEF